MQLQRARAVREVLVGDAVLADGGFKQRAAAGGSLVGDDLVRGADAMLGVDDCFEPDGLEPEDAVASVHKRQRPAVLFAGVCEGDDDLVLVGEVVEAPLRHKARRRAAAEAELQAGAGDWFHAHCVSHASTPSIQQSQPPIATGTSSSRGYPSRTSA